LIDEDIFLLQAAVENLRSADKTEQRIIDAAWRIAFRLEQIANRAGRARLAKSRWW
jgi:hypothetical protein